jgi:cysteine desulfurase/selenocysteine lyase
VLWGRREILEEWPVWQTGGEMIAEVDYQTATWGALPNRLEAGTPNIAGVIGLGAAVTWLSGLDMQALQAHEQDLLAYATKCAEELEGMHIIGTAANKIGVMSFKLDNAHPADIGFILDKQGVAIRTGDSCAQPLMKRLGLPGTARASFSIYNTHEDIDQLFEALKKAKKMLA